MTTYEKRISIKQDYDTIAIKPCEPNQVHKPIVMGEQRKVKKCEEKERRGVKGRTERQQRQHRSLLKGNADITRRKWREGIAIREN